MSHPYDTRSLVASTQALLAGDCNCIRTHATRQSATHSFSNGWPLQVPPSDAPALLPCVMSKSDITALTMDATNSSPAVLLHLRHLKCLLKKAYILLHANSRVLEEGSGCSNSASTATDATHPPGCDLCKLSSSKMARCPLRLLLGSKPSSPRGCTRSCQTGRRKHRVQDSVGQSLCCCLYSPCSKALSSYNVMCQASRWSVPEPLCGSLPSKE